MPPRIPPTQVGGVSSIKATKPHQPTPDASDASRRFVTHLGYGRDADTRGRKVTPMATPPFQASNTEIPYQLRYQLGFQARRRRPVFASDVRSLSLTEFLTQVCQRGNYQLGDGPSTSVEGIWAWRRGLSQLSHGPRTCVRGLGWWVWRR